MKNQVERREQIRFVAWFKNKYLDWHDLIHHSPNGGSRDIREGAYFKLMGCCAGRPDIEINVPRGTYHGLFIEMKLCKDSKTKGRLSKRQKEVMASLIEQGYRVAIANGCEEAKEITREYLKEDGSSK